jgi:hypothetical protein
MANIVITSTTNTILVDFGDYEGSHVATGIIPRKKIYQKKFIEFTYPFTGTDHVTATTLFEPASFSISYDGAENTLRIDSIDGQNPENNLDLFTKLSTLIQ